MTDHIIAVHHHGLLSGQGDGGSSSTGPAGKTGDLHRRLDALHNGIVVRGEVGYIVHPGIVENIPVGIAVGAIPLESIRISQSGDNLIDEKLGGNPQGHIGVAGHGRRQYTVGMVPSLLTVEQHQTNSPPIGFRHGIPHICAVGRAAAGYRHSLIHIVARGTGRKVFVGLNAVDWVVRIGHAVDSGKVPAQVLDISRLGTAGSVWPVGHGQLAI